VVLDTTGKNATSQAHSSSDSVVSLTQMMISGAMATIGVTCRITAYGNKAISIQRDWAITTAISPPSTAAAAKASTVILRVMSSEPTRLAPSVHSGLRNSNREGRM